MKRHTYSAIICLCLSLYTFSQTKLLTIQDAVLKGRTTLAPKRLSNIGFIAESKKLAYIDKNELIVVNSENGKIMSSISTVALIKRLPPAEWILYRAGKA